MDVFPQMKLAHPVVDTPSRYSCSMLLLHYRFETRNGVQSMINTPRDDDTQLFHFLSVLEWVISRGYSPSPLSC